MKEIPLTRGYVAIVDDEDYEMLSQYKWHALPSIGNSVYARSKAGGKFGVTIINMHNMLMPHREGFTVDHIDRNGLNNQRSNLRYANQSQQNFNKGKQKGALSQYKGVSIDKPYRPKKWRARAQINRKPYTLGLFHTEEEAARAYDAFMREHCGEYAVLNFPP